MKLGKVCNEKGGPEGSLCNIKYKLFLVSLSFEPPMGSTGGILHSFAEITQCLLLKLHGAKQCHSLQFFDLADKVLNSK